MRIRRSILLFLVFFPCTSTLAQLDFTPKVDYPIGQSNCSHYDINDPLSDKRTKLSDSPYDNIWLGLRRFEAKEPLTNSSPALIGGFTDTSFSIRTYSDIELLLTDSLGRKVGYDPSVDSVIMEIPNSSYYTESIGPDSTDLDSTTISDTLPNPEVKVIYVDVPSQGNYTLSVIGKNSGDYSMTFMLFPSVEGPVVSTKTGSIDSGAVSNIPFRYETNICLSKPGDADSDTQVTDSDVDYLINYLFKRGPAPSSLCSGDTNSDTEVTVPDVVYLVNYLFKGGLAPQKSNECCL